MENREFYINNDGIRLHAKLDFPEERKEKYPLVIIIHGFTGHMEERHITAAAKAMNEVGYASLRAEMYGHGQSDGQFCDHTLYKWISNALAVVDYAKNLDFVDGLYLCGHSQGGLLTMLVGAMERDLFRAIIPLSPACSIPEGARTGNFLGTSFDPEHIPDLLELNNGRTLGGNYLRAAQMIDVEHAIDLYKGPVLLIHGDQDEAIPVRYAHMAAERYTNARLVIIPGDTHCYDHHLDMVTKAMKEFGLLMKKQTDSAIWQELRNNYKEDASVQQLIFVQYTGGSSAELLMYQKSGSHWTQLLSCDAFVGKNGLGKTQEGDQKTPEGVFDLPVAFGIKDNPDSRIPYVKINDHLYWCGDEAYYNQLVDITEKPHSCQGEHLIDCAPEYHYGMFIDYNKECIYGKGSAIFLHCTGEKPYTAGCVAVAEEHMIKILQHAEKGTKICIFRK